MFQVFHTTVHKNGSVSFDSDFLRGHLRQYLSSRHEASGTSVMACVCSGHAALQFFSSVQIPEEGILATSSAFDVPFVSGEAEAKAAAAFAF